MVVSLIVGYFLDLIIGDPHRLPHPVRLIGIMITQLETILLKRKRYLKIKGLFLLLLVTGITFFSLYLCLLLLDKTHINIKLIFSAFIIFQILATKSLFTETNKVYKALLSGDLELAKKYLSYLVTRDCEHMKEADIIRSTIETIAENIVDGITSPLFYITLGGPALGMWYKAVNTLDSMVGYKNEKYNSFGFFSAKFDDFVNYIPARITSIIIVFSAILLRLDYRSSFKVLLRDKRQHSSPNSGFAEAPVAGALGIQLGGKVSYFGIFYNKLTMGDEIKKTEVKDIRDTHKIMFLSSFIFFILCIGVLIIWK